MNPASSRALLDSLLSRCSFPDPGTRVRCAVSGGADSTALLILARAAGVEVVAVHVDHGIRPESHLEADHVRSLAERFGADFESLSVEIPLGPNLEERARDARRAALGPGLVMTGHTADDQAETVLINLMRGAGLRGLAAMEPGPAHPILALRRADTEEVCAGHGIVPLHDPTNDLLDRIRNRVRHELLPAMADITERDPVPLLIRTASIARHAERALEEAASPLLEAGHPVRSTTLQAASPALRSSALRSWVSGTTGRMPSTADLARIDDVVFHRVRATEISGGWRISRHDGHLRLDRVS